MNIQNINETYFEVLWISAIDNVNVAGYRFYLDGVLKGEYIRNNDNNSIFLDTLSSGTSYTLEVEAYDDNGNVSIDNPIIVVSTASPTELLQPLQQQQQLQLLLQLPRLQQPLRSLQLN